MIKFNAGLGYTVGSAILVCLRQNKTLKKTEETFGRRECDTEVQASPWHQPSRSLSSRQSCTLLARFYELAPVDFSVLPL